VLPESGPTPEELAILARLIAEDEDGPRLDSGLPDAETNFALVGPYKPAAGFELVPVPSQEVMRAGLHLRTGFMRDRKLVQLFDYPQGWQLGKLKKALSCGDVYAMASRATCMTSSMPMGSR
jgi:hypothetical protein